MQEPTAAKEGPLQNERNGGLKRRSFLKWTGATAVALTASNLWPRQLLAQNNGGGLSLGRGDIGVLNFAYALEQLEAVFYSKVAASFYAGINSRERSILTDIRDHEVAHRNFFKKILGSAGIPELQFNFSSINFRSRESVLTTARTFEDTGVAAYNGAGQLLRDPEHLLAAGRIVSVEARHAAILRDLLSPRSSAFAGDDIVDAFGLGAVDRPSAILRKVAPYFRTPINADGLHRAKGFFMNNDFITAIEKLDSESARWSRRDVFRQIVKHGPKLALALTPFAASGCVVIGAAIAPRTGLAKETLAFAILLEELEHAFYVQALKAPGLIPASDRVVFEQIRKHEGAHVFFLNTGLTGIGGFPKKAPAFDFTGGGKYPGVFSDYRTFLEVSQMFEDTGVKAYKGQAGNLITSSKLLTAALRIHSVEARHAAEIRRLRGVKAWTGAFDEALTKAEVLEMVSPFIRGAG